MQLDLFTHDDIKRAEEIYADIKKKLSKFGIEEYIDELEDKSHFNIIKKHLEAHDHYDDYLKELNKLLMERLHECKDLEELFESRVPSYQKEDERKFLIVKYKEGKYWIQKPIYYTGCFTSDIFRKVY